MDSECFCDGPRGRGLVDTKDKEDTPVIGTDVGEVKPYSDSERMAFCRGYRGEERRVRS